MKAGRLAVMLILTGLALSSEVRASWFSREPPRPGRTTLGEPLVTLPAQVVDNYLIVTCKWDRRGPYNFLIDTGGSVTLVSPMLAERYGTKPSATDATHRDVPVKGADGDVTVLKAISLRRLELGDARFDDVPALVYDCTSISVHLGLRIDAILGFPLFRETLLTLDYPHQRVSLTSNKGAATLQPGTTLQFNNEQKTPLINLRVGDRSFIALIDSGSDSSICLNPKELGVTFAQPPRPGAVVSTLTGDRQQTVGRLNETIMLGSYALERPVVEVTDELSSIGGRALRHFVVTFNQERNQVTFYRDSREPLTFPPRRSAGMSFTKQAAYWRVVGVIPGSNAASAGVEEGDLVVRINNEPVERWGPERFDELVAKANEISFAFLVGSREYDLTLKVLDLVP